ncbi:hypothetical protein FRC10_006503, partial [Ceratobasidium sp. 414]
MLPRLNQCPFCQRGFAAPGDLRSHQQQTQHWTAPPPDLDSDSDESMADLAAGSSAFIDTTSNPELPPASSNNSHSMSDLSGLSPTRASTPFPANHLNTPSVAASPHPIEHHVQDDAAPYGIATNEEELRATIRKVLEDMVQKNMELSQELPQPSSPPQVNSQASGSASTGPNRVVNMQRLPDNIDDALSH